MNHLRKLLTMRLQPLPTRLTIVILVVALLGFTDAAYITIEHFRGVIPPCTLVSGCETVLTSPYANIFGMPVSLLGMIYYLVIAVGVFAYLDSRKTSILKWTLSLTVIGLIMSVWFIIVMAFIVQAWCLYCLGSAVSSVLLFILANIVFRKYTIQDIWQDSTTTQ